MLETLAVILVLMWLLGMVTSYTMSGFIHLLLLLALVVVVIRLVSGRRVLSQSGGDGPGRAVARFSPGGDARASSPCVLLALLPYFLPRFLHCGAPAIRALMAVAS